MSDFTFFRSHWRTFLCSALASVLATTQAVAAGPKPKPPVFKPGHYRLADGTSRTGSLCLVSDNELLVKDGGAAEPQHFAAVQVKNFVMGADSFTVLRKFDVVINGVATHYPCAMVRVYQAAGGVELYGLQGMMEVYDAPNAPGSAARGAALGMRNGLVGMAVGAAAGGLLEKKTGSYAEKMLTVLLLRTAAHPEFQTLQPKTKNALELLEAAVADQPQISQDVHRMYISECTTEKMVELLTQYVAVRKS